MSDALISSVAGRLITILEEQIRNEVNLVRGVKKEVRKLSDELRRVRNVLDDADRRGYKDESIKDWFRRLEHASYEMDDVLDEWNISLMKVQMEQHDSSLGPSKQKVCPFIPYSSCLSFKKVATRRDIALKIKNVKAQLDVILEEGKKYNFLSKECNDSLGIEGRVTTSFVDVEGVKGRDYDRDILVNKLTQNSSSASQGDKLQITSIVGTGGIGKTTLAQLVYHDSRVKDCFPLKIWVCVSDPFDEAKIAKDILEHIPKSTTPSTNQLQVLLEHIRESISGKKFLLVLDDVWNGDDTKWRPLKNSLKISGAAGSRILVTTRNERVAKDIGTIENEIHHLEQLSDEDCWVVLSRIAFSERSEEMKKRLQVTSREIVKKCGGLPLAAKALGSLLRFKNTPEEWEDVLKSEIWQLENAKVEIFPHLLLSYNDLSMSQKRCFSYCAVFSKDHKIDVDDLIRKWMALGYLSSSGGNANQLELRGREYFDNLAMHSLFQNFEKDDLNENVIVKCKMHDIVHDFAQFLREGDFKSSGDGFEAIMLNEANNFKICSSPLLVSRIKEYRSVFFESDFDLHVCDCLASVRVLEICNYRGNISTEIEKLIHLRYLNLSECHISDNDSVIKLIKAICTFYNLQSLLLTYCGIKEIPGEIGNLVQLRHLNLSGNDDLKELPESISHLHELRSLNVHQIYRLPQGLAQLTSLCTLSEFYGGSDWSKLGLLKNLNRLSGSLKLSIKLVDLEDDDDIVEQAREAELRKKMHLQDLNIIFEDLMSSDVEVTMRRRLDLIDALEPHPYLQQLTIEGYMGSKFPEWISLPVRQLRRIRLVHIKYCSSMPLLGKLPCLEHLQIVLAFGFHFVGREFLGITSSSIGFPKLKTMMFYCCFNLTEWEDITIEEEESATVSVMPCLKELIIIEGELKVLPHRLLRKVSSLEKLILPGSTHMMKSYKDGGPLTKFISHIPQVLFRNWDSEEIVGT